MGILIATIDEMKSSFEIVEYLWNYVRDGTPNGCQRTAILFTLEKMANKFWLMPVKPRTDDVLKVFKDSTDVSTSTTDEVATKNLRIAALNWLEKLIEKSVGTVVFQESVFDDIVQHINPIFDFNNEDLCSGIINLLNRIISRQKNKKKRFSGSFGFVSSNVVLLKNFKLFVDCIEKCQLYKTPSKSLMGILKIIHFEKRLNKKQCLKSINLCSTNANNQNVIKSINIKLKNTFFYIFENIIYLFDMRKRIWESV